MRRAGRDSQHQACIGISACVCVYAYVPFQVIAPRDAQSILSLRDIDLSPRYIHSLTQYLPLSIRMDTHVRARRRGDGGLERGPPPASQTSREGQCPAMTTLSPGARENEEARYRQSAGRKQARGHRGPSRDPPSKVEKNGGRGVK